jgi:hypothetical protein
VTGGTNGLFANTTGPASDPLIWEPGVYPFYYLKESVEPDPAYTKYLDDAAEAAFLWSSGKKIFHSYENETSLLKKLDYVWSKELGGMMMWDLTGDYPKKGGTTLTSVIYNYFKSPPACKMELDKTIYSKEDRLVIHADVVQPITTRFYPAYYIEMPSGGTIYITQGNRLTLNPTAFLLREHKGKSVPVSITVPEPVSDIQIINIPLSVAPTGIYDLIGGAVDASQPIVNGQINWLPHYMQTLSFTVQ